MRFTGERKEGLRRPCDIDRGWEKIIFGNCKESHPNPFLQHLTSSLRFLVFGGLIAFFDRLGLAQVFPFFGFAVPF